MALICDVALHGATMGSHEFLVPSNHQIPVIVTGEHSIGVLAAGSKSLHKAALDLVEERHV